MVWTCGKESSNLKAVVEWRPTEQRPKKRFIDLAKQDVEILDIGCSGFARETPQSRWVDSSIGGGKNSWRVMMPGRKRSKQCSYIICNM